MSIKGFGGGCSSGAPAFNDLTSGTNTQAAMVVDTGASLAASGSGTIAATSAATVSSANEASDTTCFPLFITASGTQTLQPKNNTGLTFNSSTGNLGATLFNGLTLTSTTGTFTLTNGKTLSVSNTLTFTGTDSSSVAFGTGETVAYTANNLSVFAATTSAQLAGVISDETGSGSLVFGTAPTISTPSITATLTAGASLVNGNLCYMATADGKMELTDADAAATSAGLLAMCTATIAENATGVFMLSGLYTTSGLSAGATYYISGTPGAITSTAPSGTGNVVRVVGYALSSTLLWLNPDPTYIELA